MGIGKIMTIHNGPKQIIAAANVDFDDLLTAGDVERIGDEIERALQSEFPEIYRVYVRSHENAGVKFGTAQGFEALATDPSG